jgi:hypothetical protein
MCNKIITLQRTYWDKNVLSNLGSVLAHLLFISQKDVIEMAQKVYLCSTNTFLFPTLRSY